MRIGPFPGNIEVANFMSFSYEALDVLCKVTKYVLYQFEIKLIDKYENIS